MRARMADSSPKPTFARSAHSGASRSLPTIDGIRLYQTPPPTQGISLLQMLNLIEPYDLGAMEYLGADHVHLLVQAKQLAYHDRDRWIADPAFADIPSSACCRAPMPRSGAG